MDLFGWFSRSETQEPESRSLSMGAEAAFANGSNVANTTEPLVAMSLSDVYACMYVLSSSLAQLPLHVFKKTDGKTEIKKDHEAAYLLSCEPNEWQTSYKWRETEMARCLGWGNAYTQIIRRRGEIVELKTRNPWTTTLESRMAGNRKRYYYAAYDDDTGEQITIAVDDMIHIRDFSIHEKTGISRIKQHAQTIGWDQSMGKYGLSFFNSNGRPTGLITPKGDLTEDAFNFFKKTLKANMAVMGDVNRTMALPAEVTYQAFTIPPEDMQFLESRKFARSEIASIFNVPPHMIGDLEKATFSNISEQALQFVKYTMMPWVKNWEEELNRKLFTKDERWIQGYYVKFDLGGLLRGSPKDRAEFYKAMIEMCVYSRSEVREMEDKNPMEQLNSMVISQNMKAVDAMDAEAKIKTKESEGEVNGTGTTNAAN